MNPSIKPSILAHRLNLGIDTKMPLILHNVPDEERYVGDDGLTRPYAMLFGQYVLSCLSTLAKLLPPAPSKSHC